jgi:cell division inhibitor SepF
MGVFDSFKDYFWVAGDGDKPAKVKAVPSPKVETKKVSSIRSSKGNQDVAEIVTLDPESFNDVKIIAEHFCEDIPLIINMANLSEKDSIRTLDFILGLKEGRHGHLKRVTPKVFLLTPANVMVNQGEEDETGDDLLLG